MTIRARPCRGTTSNRTRCGNMTTNPNGWCRQCVGCDADYVAASLAPGVGPGPDPVEDLAAANLHRVARRRLDRLDSTRQSIPPAGPARLWALLKSAPSESGVGQGASTVGAVATLAGHPEVAPIAAAAGGLWSRALHLRKHYLALSRAAYRNYPVPNPGPGMPFRDEPDLRSIANDGGMLPITRLALARNSRTPADLVERLSFDPDQYVRLEATIRMAAPGSRDFGTQERVLRSRAGDPVEVVRMVVADSPACPSEVLEALADDHEPDVRAAVAANPNTPPDVRVRLADDPDAEAPPHFLAYMASNGSRMERLDIARNPATPPEAQSRLIDDPDPDVRSALAANPATRPEILARLADDPDVGTRWQVAQNMSTPPEALTALATDSGDYDSGDVRRAVAENPAAPPEALKLLVNKFPELVWTHPNTSPEMLRRAAAERERRLGDVVAWACGNPSTPPEALLGVATESAEQRALPEDVPIGTAFVHYSARLAVANNSSSPPEALALLADDEDHAVRQAVKDNPNTPAQTLTAGGRGW